MDPLTEFKNNTKFQQTDYFTYRNAKNRRQSEQSIQTTKIDVIDAVFDEFQEPSQLACIPNLFSATMLSSGLTTSTSCVTCAKEFSPYACPKCGARYCGTECYRYHYQKCQ